MAPASSTRASLFAPGRNCGALDRATRLRLLIDGEAYFSTARELLSNARRTIFLVGWDLHSQTVLEPSPGGQGQRLGPLLQTLVDREPELEVFILSWDPSAIYTLEREFWPRVRHRWGTTHPRIHFEWSSDHPLGASQHQKILVVDDAIACVGGLDLTISRWDTRAHHPDDDRRTLHNGNLYGPFHDVQAMVEGPIVERIAELVRARWSRATSIPAPPVAPVVEPDVDRWPPGDHDELEDLRDIDVALARTQGEWSGHEAVREVEQLHLDMIAAARDRIYIENQFVTSRSIAAAIAATLERPHGPEVIIVTSAHGLGPLESRPLLAQRDRFILTLRQHDLHGRLAVYAPRVTPECPIKVHSKVTIVDNRVLRVGSANLSNRAMRLDSECDIAIEAYRPEVARWIRSVREDLLTEHLGCSVSLWQQTLRETEGQHIAAIERIRGGARTLVPIDVHPEQLPFGMLECLADAEEPWDQEFLRMSIHDEALLRRARLRLPRLTISALLIITLLGIWTMTPIAEWVQPERIADAARALRGHAWGPFIGLLGFCVASTLMVPVTLLIIASALLFTPWTAIVVALLGSLLSTASSYSLGRYFWSDAVSKLVGTRLRRLTQRLATTGIFSVALIRIVPVAPFAVINLVAGGARVPLPTLLLGTLFGMAPGIFALILATDRVVAAARQPAPLTIAIAIAVLVLIGLGVLGLRRILGKGRAA